MLKSLLFSAMFAFVAMGSTLAQRIAVVDINAVLESMPEYNKAQADLDKVASQWRQDIAQEYDKIKGMYNAYQAEQVLMSDDMRTQKEEEIMNAEKRVRDMQKDKFGPEGALFQRRQDLVQPIQDKVYNALDKFAAQKGFDFIFDKSSSTGLIFANPKYDKTEDVKTDLGI
jgi:outer membrane protein